MSCLFACFASETEKKGVQLVLKVIAVQFVLELIYLLQELHGKKMAGPNLDVDGAKKRKKIVF